MADLLSRHPLHLLITSAGDVTSDLLCEQLEGQVLRLNWERWSEYDISISPVGFRIADRFGREITEQSLGNIIWRKPVLTIDIEPGEKWYCFHEFKYAVEAIIEWTRQVNPRKLPIDPIRNSQVNKFHQLRVASRYFDVPEWHFTSTPSELVDQNDWITKSLTGRPIPGAGDFAKVIYTSRVNLSDLSDGFPWFVQRAITTIYDLTIVYVDGKQFGFTLERKLFSGLDWRRSIGLKEVDESWQQVTLPDALASAIHQFMTEVGLRFGRLDLLTADCSCSRVWFLELNPNGQWAWLDLDQKNGLFDAVVEFIVSR